MKPRLPHGCLGGKGAPQARGLARRFLFNRKRSDACFILSHAAPQAQGRHPALSWNAGASTPGLSAALHSRSPAAWGTPSRYSGLLCWIRGQPSQGPSRPRMPGGQGAGRLLRARRGLASTGHPQPSHRPQASPFLGCGHRRSAPPESREGCGRAKLETWGCREPARHPRGSWGASGDPTTAMCFKPGPSVSSRGRGSTPPPTLTQPESPGQCLS